MSLTHTFTFPWLGLSQRLLARLLVGLVILSGGLLPQSPTKEAEYLKCDAPARAYRTCTIER